MGYTSLIKEVNIPELVEALRHCNGPSFLTCRECQYNNDLLSCAYKMLRDAADAIEALQAEVQSYKVLADEWQSSAENKERLLGLYRAEQAKHFYSAMDDNGRIIANQCACMNIPVFSDSSEIPNS